MTRVVEAYLERKELEAELQASAYASAELFVELSPVPLVLSVVEIAGHGSQCLDQSTNRVASYSMSK